MGDPRALVLTVDLPDEDHARWVEAARWLEPEVVVLRPDEASAIDRLRPDLLVVQGKSADLAAAPGLVMTGGCPGRPDDLAGAAVDGLVGVLQRELLRVGRSHRSDEARPIEGDGRVLVFEEESFLIDIMRRVLARNGHTDHFIWSSTIADVIERIRAEAPSVVVSLVRPTLSEALLAKLRADSELRRRYFITEEDESVFVHRPPLSRRAPLELSKERVGWALVHGLNIAQGRVGVGEDDE
ncbi:MAG: hypothetical protein RMA76_19555 [Deltaproteobacteria bacterium]